MSRDLLGPLALLAPDADIPRIRKLVDVSMAVAAVSWLAFAALTAVITMSREQGFDRSVAEWLNSHLLMRGNLSRILAHLGSAPLLTPVVILSCAYFFFRRRSSLPVPILGGAYALVALVVTLIKNALRRPEPAKPIGALGYAYPSGHAAAATVAWGGLVLMLYLTSLLEGSPAVNRKAAYAAGGAVSIVCVMMLLRSAHWLTDMIAGLLLGAACLSTAVVVVMRVWLAVVPADSSEPQSATTSGVYEHGIS